jgi:hypothetical protein
MPPAQSKCEAAEFASKGDKRVFNRNSPGPISKFEMIATALMVVSLAPYIALGLSLTRVQNPSVTGGEMTVVARAHAVFLSGDGALLRFKAVPFRLSQLARAVPCIDQALLVQLTHINRSICRGNPTERNTQRGDDECDGLHMKILRRRV